MTKPTGTGGIAHGLSKAAQQQQRKSISGRFFEPSATAFDLQQRNSSPLGLW
jgi:hypothetical protein